MPRSIRTTLCPALVLLASGLGAAAAVGQGAPAAGTWYFAVSGDSRDCGNLIMPKIASALERGKSTAPIDFYWHLGDFRRMFGFDCDYDKLDHSTYDCANPPHTFSGTAKADYLSAAWPDFINHQVNAFGATPVFLGIGNHELMAGRTRDDFRRFFKKWLTQDPIHGQREKDADRHISSKEGDTYYHFFAKGVDFIYLDNADPASFSADQLEWLAKVLAHDADDPAVKTIVAGMHEALPYSEFRRHAMDASCHGLCSGQQVYDLLFRAQGLAGTPGSRKQVYVLASHAHLFVKDIFSNQPEHQGQVLPGWIVGTAGAQQYQATIQYGYLEVAVHADGTLEPTFREVTRDMPPASSGADPLVDYCFNRNKTLPTDDSFGGTCACAAAKP
jgi:hypothetical protein